MRVVDDMVLVTLNEPKTVGKLHLPKGTKVSEDTLTCTVVVVGPGKLMESGQRNQLDVKVGDEVIIKSDPITTSKFRVNGEQFFATDYMDIVCILEGDEDGTIL